MTDVLKRVVVLGGGSAGWLSAGLIASKLKTLQDSSFSVTLIESPEVKTIGVGEGSWPTLRATLQKIGISEREFLRTCDASFKQGTEFVGWTNGLDRYYHPFTVPYCYPQANRIDELWQKTAPERPFAHFSSPQAAICDHDKAPKTANEPDYAGFVNYGYHFNADKLAELLKAHCTENLAVNHILDHVESVESAESGDIAALNLKQHGRFEGDLFIDCTGLQGLLINKHYQVGWQSQRDVLFNDCAIAAQMPYESEHTSIPSCTRSTAQDCGWIWDIALQNRRGTGIVYSQQFSDDETAKETLKAYLKQTNTDEQVAAASFRKIEFSPGYRKEFWHRNCVAVGMSAGFIEPLEASAIVMVELSAQFIADQLPVSSVSMPAVSKRFNELFTYRWQQIINFLKLHYTLSKRDSAYWQAHRETTSMPDSLQELMALWAVNPPKHQDLFHNDEIFSAASYQYVMLGMQAQHWLKNGTRLPSMSGNEQHGAQQQRQQLDQQIEKLLGHLPNNRDLLALITK